MFFDIFSVPFAIISYIMFFFIIHKFFIPIYRKYINTHITLQGFLNFYKITIITLLVYLMYSLVIYCIY